MDFDKSKKLIWKLAAAFWILAIMIYLVAGTQFRYLPASNDTLSPVSALGEVVDGMTVRQRMTVPADRLDSVEIMTTAFHRQNSGLITLTLTDEAGQTLATSQLDASQVAHEDYSAFVLDKPLEGYRGKNLFMELTTQGCQPGSAVSFYFGNSVLAGRFDVLMDIAPEDCFTLDGNPGAGKLCARMNGIEYLSFYKVYWLIVGGVFLVLALLIFLWWKGARAGKNNPLVMVCTAATRYDFLLRQLISRDFRSKYKRSVLGMAWSFLNPLLTMAVQYVVFSTLFNSDTPNYPVYLLTGIVMFNFFSEAVSMGMTSITGNAALINKVYVPKYIYPISRVVSSMVNLGLSLIPLFLVMFITGTAFRPSLLLLIFDLGCLMMFVIGMVLILCTCMVFFRDTQFLWGVASMMWMYITPIFYPESIIPAQFLTLYHMNPMYQFITFARICIIDGVSPAPMAYLWCILSSVVVLGIGVLVFKRHQSKFVLYL